MPPNCAQVQAPNWRRLSASATSLMVPPKATGLGLVRPKASRTGGTRTVVPWQAAPMAPARVPDEAAPPNLATGTAEAVLHHEIATYNTCNNGASQSYTVADSPSMKPTQLGASDNKFPITRKFSFTLFSNNIQPVCVNNTHAGLYLTPRGGCTASSKKASVNSGSGRAARPLARPPFRLRSCLACLLF